MLKPLLEHEFDPHQLLDVQLSHANDQVEVRFYTNDVIVRRGVGTSTGDTKDACFSFSSRLQHSQQIQMLKLCTSQADVRDRKVDPMTPEEFYFFWVNLETEADITKELFLSDLIFSDNNTPLDGKIDPASPHLLQKLVALWSLFFSGVRALAFGKLPFIPGFQASEWQEKVSRIVSFLQNFASVSQVWPSTPEQFRIDLLKVVIGLVQIEKPVADNLSMMENYRLLNPQIQGRSSEQMPGRAYRAEIGSNPRLTKRPTSREAYWRLSPTSLRIVHILFFPRQALIFDPESKTVNLISSDPLPQRISLGVEGTVVGRVFSWIHQEYTNKALIVFLKSMLNTSNSRVTIATIDAGYGAQALSESREIFFTGDPQIVQAFCAANSKEIVVFSTVKSDQVCSIWMLRSGCEGFRKPAEVIFCGDLKSDRYPEVVGNQLSIIHLRQQIHLVLHAVLKKSLHEGLPEHLGSLQFLLIDSSDQSNKILTGARLEAILTSPWSAFPTLLQTEGQNIVGFWPSQVSFQQVRVPTMTLTTFDLLTLLGQLQAAEPVTLSEGFHMVRRNTNLFESSTFCFSTCRDYNDNARYKSMLRIGKLSL